ncbi:hypothetical protein [Actinomyces ruminis]|uniref:Type II toxin-antitoxin system prevent-host-death family antitoxin n=1 Tax=Actinomyces ruminis TaxID=1937003 RepID=A0ABX4MAI6_9ACTO|nr:hypothetical protein [Actinomyces ruminis]PHP52482.1 type II toxin-antitoxin system prevent-host-death family antitoxin [Actinomyces ruminis]
MSDATGRATPLCGRGNPADFLLTIDDYHRLGETGASLVDRLSMDDDVDVEFEPASIGLKVPEL